MEDEFLMEVQEDISIKFSKSDIDELIKTYLLKRGYIVEHIKYNYNYSMKYNGLIGVTCQVRRIY